MIDSGGLGNQGNYHSLRQRSNPVAPPAKCARGLVTLNPIASGDRQNRPDFKKSARRTSQRIGSNCCATTVVPVCPVRLPRTRRSNVIEPVAISPVLLVAVAWQPVITTIEPISQTHLARRSGATGRWQEASSASLIRRHGDKCRAVWRICRRQLRVAGTDCVCDDVAVDDDLVRPVGSRSAAIPRPLRPRLGDSPQPL
ncbi:unnamed protein product [Protopolystoma xenopodis]|uniref:Uncharacterized protein n=1 Tax=Protopolystoma xenopodis TaxID=117903 RepID=A0A3S5A4V4_9PLAT|nr:unnamed protein product [Protopolystoma xenopodis]